jgi:hypothetical protein
MTTLDISKTHFAGSAELPASTLAFATVEDGTLLFVWNKELVREAILHDEWDLIFDTANTIMSQVLEQGGAGWVMPIAS